jgi:hypothetical protein
MMDKRDENRPPDAQIWEVYDDHCSQTTDHEVQWDEAQWDKASGARDSAEMHT